MTGRPPRQILPKGVIIPPEIIYVINNTEDTGENVIEGIQIGNDLADQKLNKEDVLSDDYCEDVDVVTYIEDDDNEEDKITVYQVVDNDGEHLEEDGDVTRIIQVHDSDHGDVLLEDECEENVIYVTDDNATIETGPGVEFVQVGGPDVASEETIETSMIVEVDSDQQIWQETASPLATDHCYTFKRGIRPKDIDKAKTKAAMLGETQEAQQQYTYILPKNPTTQIISPNQSTFESSSTIFDKKSMISSSTMRQPRCTKHRWLWQFMKELLFVGDPVLQWFSQRDGSFLLKDQDGLAIKWECYKKLHKMKAQVWRQMRYYFGWMEENKIVRPVPDTTDRFQFYEKFYREKFLPYKFRPHADLEEISRMASQLDTTTDILSRYHSGLKEKVYCVRGCGSQFINKEACSRHEGVCTFVSVQT